jgi:MFS family permease
MLGHALTVQPRARATTRVWAASLAFFAAFYALLVPLPALLAARHLSDGQIGLILGTFGVAALLGRPFAGLLSDRCGHRLVMLVGAAALLLGTAGFAVVSSTGLLFAARVAQALGYVAFTTAATAQVAACTPTERRTGVLAWYGTAANVAMSLTPALVAALLPRLTLVGAVWLAAGLALAALVLVAPLSEEPDPNRSLPGASWRALLSVPVPVRVPMLLAALAGCGFAAFSQYLPLLGARNGAGSAAWGYAAYGVGITLTRVVVGRRLDRGNLQRWLVIGVLLSALALDLLALARSPGVLVLGAALLAGGSGILVPALMGLHANAVPRHRQGQAVAWYYLGFDGGMGLGGWGLALALHHAGIAGAYLAAGAVVALGLLSIPSTIRRSHHG